MSNLTFLLNELENITKLVNNSPKNNSYNDKTEEIFAWILLVFIILTICCCVLKGTFVSKEDRDNNYIQEQMRSRVKN